MTPEPEPIFGILLSELSDWEKENLCWSEVQDLQQRIRARGPISAQQQAPAAPRYFPITACYECPNRTEMHLLYKPYGMMVLPEGKELFDFMRRWVCSGKDDTEITGDNIPRWCPLSQHSTIAAQARKEGYAEGAASVIPSEEDRKTALECWGVFFDCEKECEYKPSCRIVAQAAAAERERVLPLLERLATAFHDYEMDVADYDFPAPPKHRQLMDDLQEMIDPLRSQPVQCPAGGCGNEANCPDACREKMPEKQHDGERK